MGLQNPGVKKVVSEELPRLKKVFHKKVMANVSGFGIDEYVEVCRILDKEEQVGWLEVNVSCPNVHGGGLSFGTDAKTAAAVTAAVKKATTKPVIIKLSPNVTDIVQMAKAVEAAGADAISLINTLVGMEIDIERRQPVLANVTDITEIARAVEDAGADGVSLINTLVGMRLDLRTKKPVIKNVTGGLSGPAVFPVALNMVYKTSKAVKIPVVGMGGVSSAEDVLEMILAGATAVEVGAANLVDPFACKEIVEKLPEAMQKYGIKSLNELRGKA